jgi:hypothetical protein
MPLACLQENSNGTTPPNTAMCHSGEHGGLYLVFKELLDYAMQPVHDQAEVRREREGDGRSQCVCVCVWGGGG